MSLRAALVASAMLVSLTGCAGFDEGIGGDTQVVADFFFPDIPAGNHTFRIETSTTVASGCGSAGFPEDVSTLTFYRRSTLVDVPALGGAGLAALALVLAGVSLWLLRRRRAA